MRTQTNLDRGPSVPLGSGRWEMAYRISLSVGALAAVCLEFAISPVAFALFTVAACAVAAAGAGCIALVNANSATLKITAWTSTGVAAVALCYWAEHLRTPGDLGLVVAILGVGAAAMATTAGFDLPGDHGR